MGTLGPLSTSSSLFPSMRRRLLDEYESKRGLNTYHQEQYEVHPRETGQVLALSDDDCCETSVHQTAESSLLNIDPDSIYKVDQCMSGTCRIGTATGADEMRATSCAEEVLIKLKTGADQMSDDEVADMLLDLLFAGHDTSAHGLARLIAELPRHP